MTFFIHSPLGRCPIWWTFRWLEVTSWIANGKISPIVNVNVTIQIAKIFRMIEMRSTIDFGARPSLFYLVRHAKVQFHGFEVTTFHTSSCKSPLDFFSQVDGKVANADDLTAQVPLAILPTFVIYRWGVAWQFEMPNMGLSQNRGTPKWMVYNGKPY